MIIAYLSHWLYYYDQHNQHVLSYNHQSSSNYYDQHNQRVHSNHIIINSSSKGCVRALSCSLISSCPLEKKVISDFSISSLHLWLWVFTYDDWFHILFSKGQILQEVLFQFYYFIDIHWNIYIEIYCLAMAVQLDTVVTVNETKNSGSVNLIRCHLPPATCHLVLNGGLELT